MASPQGDILSACDGHHALAVCLGGCCKQVFVGAYGCAWQIFKNGRCNGVKRWPKKCKTPEKMGRLPSAGAPVPTKVLTQCEFCPVLLVDGGVQEQFRQRQL